MNDLSTLNGQTMSSVELVKLINDFREPGQAELRHNDFTEKVRKVLGDVAAKFSAPLKMASGQTAQGYHLPKRECNLMAMSESYKVQAAVYDRMVELETKTATATISNASHIFELSTRLLKMSDTSIIRGLKILSNNYGVNPNFLPVYVNEPRVAAISTLLKEKGSPLSAQAANKILIAKGLLTEISRPSTRGRAKIFKSITEKGLSYGRNETSPENPRETQPLWYADKFDMLKLLIDTHEALGE